MPPSQVSTEILGRERMNNGMSSVRVPRPDKPRVLARDKGTYREDGDALWCGWRFAEELLDRGASILAGVPVHAGIDPQTSSERVSWPEASTT